MPRLLVGALLLVVSVTSALPQSYQHDNWSRWVIVYNLSSETVAMIRTRPAIDKRIWPDGPDLIPTTTIKPGQYHPVNFDVGDGHCLLDIRLLAPTGRYWIRRWFNVCTERGLFVRDTDPAMMQ